LSANFATAANRACRSLRLERSHHPVEIAGLPFGVAFKLADLALLDSLLGCPAPFLLAVHEIRLPLVEERANELRRNLQLLDDLPQLFPVVDQIEDAVWPSSRR
jgi:hypothetical protein